MTQVWSVVLVFGNGFRFLAEILGRAFSPRGDNGVPVPRATPWAGIGRAVGA